MASRLSRYRRAARYGVTVEEVATAIGVGAFNYGARVANEHVNSGRVAAGQLPLGPFANIKSGVRYLQTVVGLGVSVGKAGAGQKAIGKTLFLASLPQTIESVTDDTRAIMSGTGTVARRRSLATHSSPSRVVARTGAQPMAARGGSPVMPTGQGSLAQQVALTAGYSK